MFRRVDELWRKKPSVAAAGGMASVGHISLLQKYITKLPLIEAKPPETGCFFINFRDLDRFCAAEFIAAHANRSVFLDIREV